MNYNTQKLIKNHRSRLRSLFIATLFLAFSAVIILETTNTTFFFHKAARVSAPSGPISELPKSPTVSNKSLNLNTGIQKEGSDDQSGKLPTTGISTDPNTWTTSDSRLITVKSPVRGGQASNGFILTGATSVDDQIHYRLIDDTTGVISEGPISVVSGKFSANINFTTTSRTGRLDVFNTDEMGRELNEVQLMVRF